jgi:hypothetical protein
MKNYLLTIIVSLSFGSIFSQNSFKAVDSEEYFIGDTIVLGNGSPLDSKYVTIKYNGVAGDTSQFFRAMPKIPNTKVVIKRIFTNQFGEITFETISSSNYYYRIPVDRAISKGELKSKNLSFRTSDEALSELKKAKEKLDLGLITKDDYDKKVNELKKYINE